MLKSKALSESLFSKRNQHTVRLKEDERYADFSWKIKNAENLDFAGFPAEFLASPRRLERPTYRLGGDRSIQLSYEDLL